jgi:PleD family two-component response regulator
LKPPVIGDGQTPVERAAQIALQFHPGSSKLGGMTQPLALVLYEKLLPGSQVVNRLQDMNYRVQTVADPATLAECAAQSKPMLALVDLTCTKTDICAAITRLRQNDATKHLPVIGFGGDDQKELQAAALAAGVTLVVSEGAILQHLSECLDQALQVE